MKNTIFSYRAGCMRTVVTVTLAGCFSAFAQTSITTDFDAGVFSDGYLPGSGTPFGISGAGDTVDGWTWYTEDSATNTITVPLNGGGTATVGEQVIRSANNGEYDTSNSPDNYISIAWGTSSRTALRRTFTGVSAGTANVDWQDNTLGGFYAYYSQNGDTSYTALIDGADFTAVAGDLEILFVGNDGADSSSAGDEGIQSITVSFGGSGADTTPPTVTATDPVDGTSNIVTSTNLVATFSEDIAVVPGGFIYLTDLDTPSVATIAATDASQVTVSGNQLTIDPASDLSPGTTYAVTFGAMAISDLATTANFFADTTFDIGSWNFTTDGTDPLITSITPLNNEGDVSPSTDLGIVFSEDVSGVAAKDITIHLSGGGVVDTIDAGSVTILGNEVAIDPAITFASGTQYYINI